MKRRQAIIVSGWAHGAEVLDPLASALAGCCAVELVAFPDLNLSGSGPPDYAGGLMDRVRRHADGGACLIAWSMGGMVALEAASRLPQEVVALVLLSTTPRFCQDDGFEWGADPKAVRAMRIGMRRAPEGVLRDFFTRAARPHELSVEKLNQKTEAALAMGNDSLTDGLDYLLEADVRPALSHVVQPSLVIHGQRDEIVSWRAGESLDHALDDSHFVLVPDGCHALPEQHPSLIADHITGFVEALP